MNIDRNDTHLPKIGTGLWDFNFRPGAALLGALRIRRLRFKAVSGLVLIGIKVAHGAENGALRRMWRIATNMAQLYLAY